MNSKNNKQIILRLANNDDIYELRRCNKLCLPVYYPYNIYENFINSSNSIVIVMAMNKKIIGYIIGEKSEEVLDRFHIISFAVCKEFRKNKIGTLLMNKIISLAIYKYKYVKKISLYVMKTNEIARSFYEKLGFENTKLMKNYYSFNEDGYLYMKNI